MKFEPDTIRTRLRELAFLNSAATISFRAAPGAAGADGLSISESLATQNSGVGGSDGGSEQPSGGGNGGGPAAASAAVKGSWETLHFSGGLEEYVRFNNRDNSPLHDPIYVSRTVSFWAP